MVYDISFKKEYCNALFFFSFPKSNSPCESLHKLHHTPITYKAGEDYFFRVQAPSLLSPMALQDTESLMKKL